MSLAGIGPVTSAPELPQDRYWLTVDGEQLPQVILSKALRYRDRLRRDGRLDLFRRTERVYFGQDANGGMANSAAIQFGGEAGELILIRVNHFRSLLSALIEVVVKSRLSYDPRATNNDTESAQQVTLAKSLLEYYGRLLGDDAMRRTTALCSLLFGEGYTAQRWNTSKGKPYVATPDPNAPPSPEGEPGSKVMFEGDVDAQTFTPVEVIHDIDATERELQWVLLPYRANVWDLAAEHPESSDEILKMRGSAQQRWPRSAWSSSPFEKSQTSQEADIVTVWYLYALPSPALPEGRHAQVCGDVLLHDGPMPYERIPVRVITPETEVSISRGHSPAFDLLALQEAVDSTWDTILTMIDAYGLQSIIVPKGSDFSPEVLGKGVQMLEWTPNPDLTGGGKPETLNLLDLPPELATVLEKLKGEMETLSTINAVVRGNLSEVTQLKSGAALALVQSLTVQLNGNFQAGVVAHDEGVATDRLMILKQFATNKRMVEVVGTANSGSMREWSADNLSTVQRVTVEMGSPLQDQTAGKMEIAQQFLANGMIQRPGQYFEVLKTGRLDPIIDPSADAEQLMLRENELLTQPDRLVVARLTDDHCIHVSAHGVVLSQQSVRENPALTERVMQHIMEHQKMWLGMDPALALMTKQSVMPPSPVAPPGPNPTQEGPPSGKAPEKGSEANKARPLGGPPPPGGPSMPRVGTPNGPVAPQ